MSGRTSAPTEKVTRQQALAEGLKRYFTGVPCPRGHMAERFVSVRACVACKADERRRWDAKNSDKVNARVRRWQQTNRDKVRQQQRIYRAANADKRRAWNRRWVQANPQKQIEYYRRNKYGITNAQFDAMLAAQNGVCRICGTDQPGGIGAWHIDHCHSSNRIRGILCQGCNIGLGAFRDNPQSLLQAIQYLKAANGR